METKETLGGEAEGLSASGRTPAKSAGAERWPDPEVVGRPVMRKFSAEYKRRMVEEAARCKPGEIGALLRREGVYSSALTRWRKQYRAGVLSGLSSKAPGPKPKRAGQLAAEVARLERENRRGLLPNLPAFISRVG